MMIILIYGKHQLLHDLNLNMALQRLVCEINTIRKFSENGLSVDPKKGHSLKC